jgi:hypothetical protein
MKRIVLNVAKIVKTLEKIRNRSPMYWMPTK